MVLVLLNISWKTKLTKSRGKALVATFNQLGELEGCPAWNISFVSAWQELFLPIVDLKNYSKFIVTYLSNLLDKHSAMDSSRVSQDQLFAMIDMVNAKRSGLAKDVSSDLIKQLSKYKVGEFCSCNKFYRVL